MTAANWISRCSRADHTARTARGRIVEVATNEPIHVGGVTVSPGDYVVADGSAAVFIAQAEIGACWRRPKPSSRAKKPWPKRCAKAHPISQVMGANYEHMLKKVNHMNHA